MLFNYIDTEFALICYTAVFRQDKARQYFIWSLLVSSRNAPPH